MDFIINIVFLFKLTKFQGLLNIGKIVGPCSLNIGNVYSLKMNLIQHTDRRLRGRLNLSWMEDFKPTVLRECLRR